MDQRILFICSTNSCCSPLAAGCLVKLLAESGLQGRFVVSSAGTYSGITPRPADRRAVEIAAKHGLDISEHRTREVEKETLFASDLCIAMDEDAYWFVRSAFPGYPPARMKLFMEYSNQMGQREVKDPVLDSLLGFSKTYEIIAATCPNILAQLRKDAGI